MPYITRDDGERFVIPSYRDVLSAKKKNLLKKEILLLSANYGEYITLQRKSSEQYEAAFSPDAGYLLGESIWHYFKRPVDLIYCEAIANTNDAILVIVKGGSVYLDGSFPIDSIVDELVIFRTQQNNFDIYIYGDVPISQQPEEGKVALAASSIKTFNILPAPIFPTLPTLKNFQLRLVDVVLTAQGIGTFPAKQVALSLAGLGLVWMMFSYMTSEKQVEAPIPVAVPVNLNQAYILKLSSPAPSAELQEIVKDIVLLYTMPGWVATDISYAAGVLQAKVHSSGIETSFLFKWAEQNHATVHLLQDGFSIALQITVADRSAPTTISQLQAVVGELIDRVSLVSRGNNLVMGNVNDHGQFVEAQLTLSFNNLTPATLSLLADQLKGLPLVLSKATLSVDQGNLSGNIILQALGN